jgi:hypothetical protein
MYIDFPSKSVLMLILLSAIVALLCGSAAGENTPPQVAIHTPEEGANLALSVTVSGKATDTEGFNIDSYVEAKWNDWEWFRLPNTPADGNRSIVFGEMVNLDFHAPGDHVLHLRAFDGELHSPVVQVNVSVRDLPDLVILPSDITIHPQHPEAGAEVDIKVIVRNQGGEDVHQVEITLSVDGEEVDRRVIGTIDSNTQFEEGFEVRVKEGNNTIVATAMSLGPITEKSLVNNQAERTFTVPESQPADYPGGRLFILGLTVVFIMAIVVYLAAFAFRKD